MGLYKRILVPIEGSPTDGPVLAHVRELADVCGAEVYLLRVAHYHTRDSRTHELDDANEDLERAAEVLRGGGLTVRTVLGHGEPAEEIIAQAEKLGVDLIAMATHGHRWLGRLVYGSVADHIRHGSDVPLLLIKAHGDDQDETVASGDDQDETAAHG